MQSRWNKERSLFWIECAYAHTQTDFAFVSFNSIRMASRNGFFSIIIITMKGTPHHFNLDCFVGSVITVIGFFLMCAHACQFFALFCFPLIHLFSYVDFIIVILSFYRVMKAGAFVCCRFTIGVKIKEKFLKNVRTHLNSCCFCASYKWKNNNNSCRLFTSTKALRCSLFSLSILRSRGSLLLPLFLFSRPIFFFVVVAASRTYILLLCDCNFAHSPQFYVIFSALFHSLHFYFNTSFLCSRRNPSESITDSVNTFTNYLLFSGYSRRSTLYSFENFFKGK